MPWNGSPGTRIEVRHLFFNTPARRKFLKGVSTEMVHVSEVFTRVALAHLGTHFTLRHNGKLLYEVPASLRLLERLRSGRLESQRLPIPETVQLLPSQAALVLEQNAALAELGLEVQGFGGGTLLLSSYPAILGKQAPRELLQAVVDQILSKERVPSRE